MDLSKMLDEFPADFDIQLSVCCRGEIGHGTQGVRRWTATAVTRLPMHDEIQEGTFQPQWHARSSCCRTPEEALVELRAIVESGDDEDSRHHGTQ